MRTKLSTFLVLLFAVLLLQGCSLKSRIKNADKRFAIGEYYAAGNLYKKIYYKVPYKDKPLRARIAFQQGECNRLINNNRAVQAYANAIRSLYSDSIVLLNGRVKPLATLFARPICLIRVMPIISVRHF